MREYISLGIHIFYWLIIIALLLVTIGGSLSQPPAPPGYSQNQTQSNNKGYGEQEKGEGSKAFRQRATEDPAAFFTLCLVFFTAILSFSTIGLWLVTGTAARAARDSADALPNLERAYIFLEVNPNFVRDIAHYRRR
jgi:hypothetical protein